MLFLSRASAFVQFYLEDDWRKRVISKAVVQQCFRFRATRDLRSDRYLRKFQVFKADISKCIFCAWWKSNRRLNIGWNLSIFRSISIPSEFLRFLSGILLAVLTLARIWFAHCALPLSWILYKPMRSLVISQSKSRTRWPNHGNGVWSKYSSYWKCYLKKIIVKMEMLWLIHRANHLIYILVVWRMSHYIAG